MTGIAISRVVVRYVQDTPTRIKSEHEDIKKYLEIKSLKRSEICGKYIDSVKKNMQIPNSRNPQMVVSARVWDTNIACIDRATLWMDAQSYVSMELEYSW